MSSPEVRSSTLSSTVVRCPVTLPFVTRSTTRTASRSSSSTATRSKVSGRSETSSWRASAFSTAVAWSRNRAATSYSRREAATSISVRSRLTASSRSPSRKAASPSTYSWYRSGVTSPTHGPEHRSMWNNRQGRPMPWWVRNLLSVHVRTGKVRSSRSSVWRMA